MTLQETIPDQARPSLKFSQVVPAQRQSDLPVKGINLDMNCFCQLFVEQAPIALALLDRNLQFVQVSQRWLQDYELSQTPVIEHTLDSVFPYLPSTLRSLIQQALAGTANARQDAIFSLPSGAIEWMNWEVKPWQDQQGEIAGLFIVSQVVTAQKQAEQQLRQREEQLRQFVEYSPHAIAMFDCNMTYLAASRRWIRDYGLEDKEVIGQSHYHLFPKISPQWQQVHARCLAGAIEKCEEEPCLHGDGSTVWERWEVRPWYDTAGNIGGIIIFTEVITERKEAEEAVRRSEAQLRQQTEQLQEALHQLQQTQMQLVQSEKMSSLGQLVAGIAHEINNPVNFIHGNLNHAEGYITDLVNLVHLYQEYYPQPVARITTLMDEIDLEFLLEDLPKILVSMQVGTERIREIVRSLRNFSRKDESDMKVVDIHEGIDSTLMILQSRFKARPDHPGIQLVKEYGELPAVACYAGQLNQVFMNILANALDALEERDQLRSFRDCEKFPSRIWIQTELLYSQENLFERNPKNADPSHLLIRIRDNGPGIPDTVRQRLFDPFFTTKPVGKGTGLGLSISYQIITEKHKGELICASTPGQGTEFIIKIPFQQSLVNAPVAIAKSAIPSSELGTL